MFQMRKDENNGWALVLAANASKQKDAWNDVIKIDLGALHLTTCIDLGAEEVAGKF